VFPAIPRKHAATCGEPSGTVRHTCHRRPCRPWPARRTRTPGRTGNRSDGESALITSLQRAGRASFRGKANAQHDGPRYHRHRGTVVPCRAARCPFAWGRVARVSLVSFYRAFFLCWPVISICCPVRARSEACASADRGLYANQGPARWQGDRGGGRPRSARYQRS
jgi:hypothetical protein